MMIIWVLTHRGACGPVSGPWVRYKWCYGDIYWTSMRRWRRLCLSPVHHHNLSCTVSTTLEDTFSFSHPLFSFCGSVCICSFQWMWCAKGYILYLPDFGWVYSKTQYNLQLNSFILLQYWIAFRCYLNMGFFGA